jgi:hypothetical protein
VPARGWMKRLRLTAPFAALWLTACSVVDFTRPGTSEPESSYATVYSIYAEFCALSQIKKKPGFGAEIRGEIGGHAAFYVRGACRSTGSDQQLLRPCGDPDAETAEGVGISMNEHFRNTKWIAVPGRELFFNGNLQPGERLTRDRYRALQAEVQQSGLLDGIEFHPWVFADMPPGTSPEEYKYEVSVATDYAVGFGRGRYCARVAMTRPQLLAMIDFLNAENAPYRSGRTEFRWSLFQDNCIHLAHNALAATGIWSVWPTNRSWLISVFDFPVPKNEFVNLMRRTNDTALLDPIAAWQDPAARRSVLQYGQLPVRPGAIALSWPAHEPNDVYETALKLVFYDEPHLGPYRGWLEAILTDPRRINLERNLEDFATRYRQVRSTRPPVAWWLAQAALRNAEPADAAAFHARFYAALDQGIIDIDRRLVELRRVRATQHLAAGHELAAQ